MGNKVEVTKFKTDRINKYTGGKIDRMRGFGKSKLKTPTHNPPQFQTKGGISIGDYARGWWYFKNNMKVYDKYPNGVAIVVKDMKKDPEGKNIKSVVGYTHRGATPFKIGDRLFDERYKPKKGDYTSKQWAKWEKEMEATIKRNVKEGWYDNVAQARKSTRISDVIPYKLRGKKKIETWDEAIKAAKNMSDYLG